MQSWSKLEKEVAELYGEKKITEDEIKQRENKIIDLEIQINKLQAEINELRFNSVRI